MPTTRFPFNGYLFAADRPDPLTCSDDCWDTEMDGIPAGSDRIGTRSIDGARCVVFRTPGGQHKAITAVAAQTVPLDD